MRGIAWLTWLTYPPGPGPSTHAPLNHSVAFGASSEKTNTPMHLSARGDEGKTMHQQQCPFPSRRTPPSLPVPSSTSDAWTWNFFSYLGLVKLKAANKTSVEKQPFFSVWRERVNPVSSSPGKGLSQSHRAPQLCSPSR